MYYLLCAEVLMTSAYQPCSTGSTLVVTTGVHTLSTNPQAGPSLFGYLPPLPLSLAHHKTVIDSTSIYLLSLYLGLHPGVLPTLTTNNT
jgi:hypothetical protein